MEKIKKLIIKMLEEENNNNQLKNIQRNPFVALCDYASRGNWCWNIICTTCGHSGFRVAFSKLIHGQHPDDDSFWPDEKTDHALYEERGNYGDFVKNANRSMQTELASIVAEAKLSDIQAIAKFPDWLGYIGLVMNHCPDLNARMILSDAFLPQFIVLVKNNGEIYDYLQEKQSKKELLNIDDLSKIENSMLVNRGK